MKSSPLFLILSIATAVSCLDAKVSQYTVKEYNNKTPFLSFYAQNRFLNLPGPPSTEVKGFDLIDVNVPAPLETYLWELTGYYQAESTGEYTFSIGETKAAGIQLGEKNSSSVKFHEIALGELKVFTENSVLFPLEKYAYYRVKITYISGSERVPVYITVDGTKVELNDQIMNLSTEKIVDELKPKSNEVDEKSPEQEEPKKINEIKENSESEIQKEVESQVAAAVGGIKESINSQIDGKIPASTPIEKSELEKQINNVIDSEISNQIQKEIPSDIDERVDTLGGIQSNTAPKDAADSVPLDLIPKNPSVVEPLDASAKKEENPVEQPVLDAALTNNLEKEKEKKKVEGVDGAKNTKDVPKKIDQTKLDETAKTSPELKEKPVDGQESKKVEKDVAEKVDAEKLKNDPKPSTSKGVSKREVIDGVVKPTGFFYSLKLVTEGLDLNDLLKDHSQLLLLEVGFFDSRYTGAKNMVNTPYITEILGHAQAPIAGLYQIVMTDKIMAAIQVGPGVKEKQTQYSIDNKWTIMDTRISVQGEVVLQPGLFYPFRMVLIGQSENFRFDMTLFDPKGVEVDLFRLWQTPAVEEIAKELPTEKKVTSSNSGSSPALPVDNVSGVSGVAGVSGVPSGVSIANIPEGKYNISNGTTSESSPIASSIQGSNVADLSLGLGSSGHSSMSFNAHAHLSASFAFSACVSGSVCVSPIHPNLVHTGTLVAEDKPTKYFSRVEADQYSTPTSSPERGSLQASANILGPGTLSGESDGKPGIDGKNGKNGENGKNGKNSQNGKNGKPSENGDIMDTTSPNNRLNDSPRIKEDSGPLDTLPKTKEPEFPKDKLSNGDSSSPSKGKPDANRDSTESGRKSVDTYTPSSHQEKPVPTLYEGSGSKATSGFSFVSGLILLLLI